MSYGFFYLLTDISYTDYSKSHVLSYEIKKNMLESFLDSILIVNTKTNFMYIVNMSHFYKSKTT